MKGQQSLFSDLFSTENISGKPTNGFRPFGAARNECLVHRYYYYLHFQGKRYDLIINYLSNEFFLAPITIPDLLADNVELVRRLITEHPPVEELQKKYPFMVWV